jgi:hypothetical protein
MTVRIRSIVQAVLLLGCLATCAAAFAQAAGKVVFAIGDVAAIRGSARVALAAGASLNVGDTIVTGAQSHAQLRFSDDALVALKPDSEFRIERYTFNGRQDGTDAVVFRLVKGGLRTLTGQIGKVSRDQYQLLTTQATIGIRGTHYQLQLCAPGQCMIGAQAASSGVYGGVYDGRIVVENALGSIVGGAGEYFYVPDGNSPQRFLFPPEFLSDRLEGLPSPARGAVAETRFVKVPAFEPAPSPDVPRFVFLATENLNQSALFASSGTTILVGSDRYTLELDSTTNPDLQLGFGSGGQLLAFNNGMLVASLGSATVVDAGTDGTAAGLTWGRWTGSGSSIAQTLGNEVVHNDGGNLHYIYGNTATGLPTSGQVSYAAVGGTRPTDSGTGAVGTLVSGGTINVNFTTAQLALSGLSVGFGSANYTLSGSSSISNGLFSTGGNGGGVASCTGGGCQALVAGNFAGFFAGPGGQGIGMDYYFNTRTGSVIEGVAGYHQCPAGHC